MTKSDCLIEQAEVKDFDSSIIVDGMRFSSKLYNSEVIRSALKYIPRDNDIFVITTPKSGTTWMQTIVYALLTNGHGFDEDIDDYMVRNPFLEMHGPQAVETMQRPGAIKTHLDFDHVPYHPNAKYICVLRNPKDVCVSFHRFINSMEGEIINNVTFNTIVDTFLNGKLFHVDYFDHLLSCWSHRNDNNVLIVLYEDMKKDIRPIINRIAKFLNIEMNEKLLERTVTVSSIDYLKQRGYNEKLGNIDSVTTFKLIRKGIVGDWRTVLSKEQSQLIDARFRQKTRNIPELYTLWDDYDLFEKE